MEGSIVQAFLIGFAISTVLYFIFSGLVYIKLSHEIDHEDDMGELTSGKCLPAFRTEVPMPYKESTDFLTAIADNKTDQMHTADEIAKISRELLSLYFAVERKGMKKKRLH